MMPEPNTIHQGDALTILAELPEASFDSCVTDPPYGWSFMNHAWDAETPGPTLYQAILRVLKPGAFLLAFGGPRTFHRTWCAIEDAGFEMRDTLCWLYGQGFPKARTCLKPAWEPICLARKPCEGSARANREKHGTGFLNIEESRINAPLTKGRWPANVVIDCPAAQMIDEESGWLHAPGNRADTARSVSSRPGRFDLLKGVARHVYKGPHDHGGGASRFFYCGKARTAEAGEGNTHPCVKPLTLMRWLVRLVTPTGGIVLDPLCGSGSTLVAARQLGYQYVGCERESEWADTARRRLAEGTGPLFAEAM